MSEVADRPETVGYLTLIDAQPAEIIAQPKKFDEFLAEITKKVRSHTPDLSTVTSRKEIGSLAYKVARTKTALDEAGKELNSDLQERINTVNAVRKTVRDRLDALRDEVRKPLDEWEALEKERVDNLETGLAALDRAGIVTGEETADDVEARLADLRAMEIGAETHQEFEDRYVRARDYAVKALETAVERLRKDEADKAELEQLRAAKAKSDAEAAERAEKEAAAAREAEQAAAARVAAEKAAEVEAQRIEAAKEAARIAAEEAAARHQREKDEAHAAELARIEVERQAERDAAEAERKAEAARAADKAHRSKIMTAAKVAIMEHCGIENDAARALVIAIKNGRIPNVTLKF